MKDQSNASNKKADVDATVTQAETTWSSTEVNVTTTGTIKTGNISATGLTSGSWKGTFNFSIAMSDAQ